MRSLALVLVVAFSAAAMAKGGGGGHGGSGRSSSHTSTSSHSSSGDSHTVRGHYTKDGTYVQPHHATNPDGTKTNNWSTKGNVNPHTGKEGTKEP